MVILGLACVKVAQWYPGLGFLRQADAVAALLVAVIVVVISTRLGFRTVEGLLDTSPAGAAERIKARVEQVDKVLDCHAVRVRHSGPQSFVDLHITLDRHQPLYVAHALTEEVERVVNEIVPGADVTVHPEPSTDVTEPPAGGGRQQTREGDG